MHERTKKHGGKCMCVEGHLLAKDIVNIYQRILRSFIQVFFSDHGALINRCFYLTIIESVGQKKDLDNMDRGLITLL